jgi:site-specific recombinase XerD
MAKGCRALSDTEVSKVLSALKSERDRCLFILGLRTGFRISELLSIRIQDVYQGNKALDQLRVLRGNLKDHKTRTVALHAQAKEYILEYVSTLTNLDPTQPLFLSQQGVNKALTRHGAAKVLKQAYAEAGLTGPGLATHSMRKSFAVRVYEKLNHDLLSTQKALGHSGLINTLRYLPEPAQDKIDDAIKSA